MVGGIALFLENNYDFTPFNVKSALYAIDQENQDKNKQTETGSI